MNQPHQLTIVSLGEILWDLLPGGRQLGGAPANFAWHAQSHGAQAIIVSSVGQDSDGQEIKNNLASANLMTGHIQTDTTHPTGTVSVTLQADGQPIYDIHQPVAWDFIQWSPELAALARRADAVCLGTLAQRSEVSRKTLQSFLEHITPQALCVFDMNLRQSFYTWDIINATLRHCHVLKINEDELAVLSQLMNINDQSVLPTLMQQYPQLRIIALTLGRRGSTLLTRDHQYTLPAQDIKVADTVGAGDSFTATLTMGLLKGLPVAQIHEMAMNVASYVCTQHGAMPHLPTSMIIR